MANGNGNGNGATPIEQNKAVRAAIFAHPNTKQRTSVIEFFGQQVEIRQATLGSIMEAQTQAKLLDNPKAGLALAIIQNVYTPGTDDLVFEPGDVDSLLAMPFGEDMMRMSDAIGKMTSVDFLPQKPLSDTTTSG
jgi:hypothetical protein